MAASQILLNVDNFLFECPVCLSQFDEDCRMLHCQHVFCIKCLENIFQATVENEKPSCPICRISITVSLEQLVKPRLLLNLLKTYTDAEAKRISNEHDAEEVMDKDISKALDNSIESFEREKLIEFTSEEHEHEQLNIALMKSEEDERKNERIQSFKKRIEDLELAVSMLKTTGTYDVNLKTDNIGDINEDEGTNEGLTRSSSELSYKTVGSNSVDDIPASTRLCASSSNSEVHLHCNNNLNLHEINEKLLAISQEIEDENNESQKSSIACCSSNNYERKVFNTFLPFQPSKLLRYGIKYDINNLYEIIQLSNNEKRLSCSSAIQLREHVAEVDDYIKTIALYRSDLMKDIMEECCEGGSGEKKYNDLNNLDEIDSENEEYDEEEKDLLYAIELSRQSYIEKNEDTALAITMKISKYIDPIDNFVDILKGVKNRLELMLVVLVSDTEKSEVIEIPVDTKVKLKLAKAKCDIEEKSETEEKSEVEEMSYVEVSDVEEISYIVVSEAEEDSETEEG